MTELYIIRHGEAEGNLYRRIHGQFDSALTERGEKQVMALARRFEGVKIDAVYSSDLARAASTAAAIYVPKNLPLTRLASLREMALGDWEDLPWGEVETNQKEQYRYFSFEPDRWSVPGGEGWDELCRRIYGAVTDIAARNEGRTVAVFTHGCAIRALMSVIEGVAANEISRIPHYDNTAVTLLRWDGRRLSTVFAGDSSHLPDELTAFRRETWWSDKSGTDGRNMRFLPFGVSAEKDKYLSRYREAWVISYGSERGFTDIYHDWAVMRSIADPNAVVEGVLGGKTAGMIELAPEVGSDEGRGHIAFLCMDEDYRARGLGVQLIGYAVSYYRALGRDRLSLRVTEKNEQARRFYERCGFKTVRREPGGLGAVLQMEKGIRLP